MQRFPRFNEYKVLAYRIFLVYLFYMVVRFLFFAYNPNLIRVESYSELIPLAYHGLAFDTTAILYANALFIVLSLLPFGVNTRKSYQLGLKILYFTTNALFYALNFVDLVYYRYSFNRSTRASLDILEHEGNKAALMGNFLVNYWHVFVWFFALLFLWIYLYGKQKVKPHQQKYTLKYFFASTATFLLVCVLCMGGIRGDFRKSTRPINMIDANRFVTDASQADFVLNTPFAVIRTWNANTFKKVNLVDKAVVDSLLVPIKHYRNRPKTRPNIVVLILESFGREYISAFNTHEKIPGYRGYAPFVDSLAQHSLIFTRGYANGYKSIHGMSSVLSGIPSFKDAFTSSPYPKQKIESLVSILKSEGYDTSFFHGSPNGSMGFLGFSNILGFDHYYGKNEYGNDADFDGVWGIWDEPFFQYFNRTISAKKQPFMATLFSVSSHEPYVVPEKYKGKFPKGDIPIHQTIGYTDYALKQFFKAAQMQPWYSNTIFVLVADHDNLIHYDLYYNDQYAHTVPILFYTPGHTYQGVSRDWAQQIDIFPTLMDMIGYDKPFRSWGRSLLGDPKVPPFVMRYSSDVYQMMSGNYICTFDGEKAVGFYHKDDYALKTNLIKQRNAEMNQLEMRCKAFLQDYMERIIDKKLTSKSN
ncbi:MAG: LTA synthase family protein [Flavobacterium sp.]|jgi:phosphoglycerol transferase MdoB-like AlkP superfamily enzyme|uniref:LTA synthase family protein n=1 Tax=Flavobacterium sp. TaxID=239 RepID=UPI0022C946AD|nr:LTA synthase family protein [Flavobacterium sp.]MCZ8167993.1 LTA synthase family protein [Flavobacterium sp.]MCZ8298425.1 LTA synthase family protein [Flavobacterium sp.]